MTIRPSSYQGLPFKWKRDPRRGLVIQGVAPGSGLGKAGFVNGSRLMGVDGVPIMNEDELKVILWCKRKQPTRTTPVSQNELSGAPGVCFPNVTTRRCSHFSPRLYLILRAYWHVSPICRFQLTCAMYSAGIGFDFVHFTAAHPFAIAFKRPVGSMPLFGQLQRSRAIDSHRVIACSEL